MSKCFYCGKESEDGKVNINNPNEFVCYDCWKNHPRCSECSKLLPPGGFYYKRPNGQKLCIECNSQEEKTNQKKKGEVKYWTGVIIGGIVVACFIGLYLFFSSKRKNDKE